MREAQKWWRMVRVKLHNYGPKASVKLDDEEFNVGPDIFIALEGIGTFEGVTFEQKLRDLLASGKDIRKLMTRVHRESTRRGHASITTSLNIQLEITECSRVLSLMLVSPPFGSYLQESQRRKRIDTSYLITPPDLGAHDGTYRDTFGAMLDVYDKLIESGIELEDARYVLPLGVKTSLFASISFENYVGLIQYAERHGHEPYTPWELRVFVSELLRILSEVSPAILEARLFFRNRLATYPYPNPFKKGDKLLERLVRELGEPDEAVVLGVTNLVGDVASIKDVFMAEDKEEADSLNPLIQAITLEPMSLVAYHQAIRHRTVPTAVESIHTAAERALREPERNIVIPPSVKKDDNLARLFLKTSENALRVYSKMIREGVRPSSACYILPQALRIYVVRMYNGYNLLYPQGFIGTRTCSTTQWEERGIAYKVWREIERYDQRLAGVMGEKCKMLGYCPEKEWCPIILKYHHYDDELHRRYQSGAV